MRRIPVHRRGELETYALVSDEDADLLAWSYWTFNDKGYARRRVPRTEYMHRVVAARMLGRELAAEQVHHGPGGKLDNRRSNLMICANHQEHKAQHFDHPGVRWDGRRSQWIARPTINGVKVFLGRYETREAAIAAVEEARGATTSTS